MESAYSSLKAIDYHLSFYRSPLKLPIVRTVKFLFLAAIVIGLFSMIGCTKNNNSTTVVKDSVYYSPWTTIAMSPTDAGDTIFTGTISASHITASIVSSGAVLTYLGEPGNPATGDTAAESTVDFGLYTTMVTGSIQLLSFGAGSDFSTSNSGFVFRYVVIPGTVLATTKLTPQQLKAMNYTEVTKLLNTAGKTGSASPLSTQ
jgi:hypothetical protein